jgi:hypothetical protein
MVAATHSPSNTKVLRANTSWEVSLSRRYRKAYRFLAGYLAVAVNLWKDIVVRHGHMQYSSSSSPAVALLSVFEALCLPSILPPEERGT